MSYSGFYKRRRGVLEHLEAGRISLLDLAVHDLICLRANAVVGNGSAIPSGVWFGSATAIHALCPREISERAIQRSLQHLENIGWIKRWMTPGKHGNYPILIARYSVAELSGKEYIVTADATTDWQHPKLECVTESSSLRGIPVTRAAPYREKRSKKRPITDSITESVTEDSSAQKAAPRRAIASLSTDKTDEKKLSQRALSDAASRLFAEKHQGKKPTWPPKHFVQLAALLRIRPDITVSEFSERYANFLDSPIPFHRQQGGSLAFFCSNYDAFIEPTAAANPFGGSYVSKAHQRERENMRSAQVAVRRGEARDRDAAGSSR